MSELDDLRIQNKELKRLLGNALELLEKTKLALTRQAQLPQRASKKAVAGGRRAKKKAAMKVPGKKKRI
jgi:hypothetical protein